MSDDVTIKIPRPLYNRLQEIVAGTGFRSVTEFVVYVLRDLAAVHAQEREGRPSARPSPLHGPQGAQGPQAAPEAHEDQPSLTREEIEAIRKRLRNLGYLD